ncbi:hypothetical protein [Comamonas thiooxydans]|uniref:hypothetical protein n=1 Tax=Comamonas thiooxydans TaxID=363952 RepID=UPI003D0608D0
MNIIAPDFNDGWVFCSSKYTKTLPVVDFPCDVIPSVFDPERTVLKIDDRLYFHVFNWCYLRRKSMKGGGAFDAYSISMERVKVLPKVLMVLSKWFRFKNHRPRTIHSFLQCLGNFLSWVDHPDQEGKYEKVLSDADLALVALKKHHTYLRNLLQSHQITSITAGNRENLIIECLSEVHSRIYKDYIEPLKAIRGKGTEVPDTAQMGEFSSTLQAVFDSASEVILSRRYFSSEVQLRVSASDDTKLVKLRKSYGPLRLMELACVAYAGLVFIDSGANLAVLQDFEEPEDLDEQLVEPDRINLKLKAIKFRAAGKQVEVHLSATTMTRLKTYIDVRQALIKKLQVEDIAPLFIHCTYRTSAAEPTGICPLSRTFSNYLRRKLIRAGAYIPNVTLRELRAYKQQELVKKTTVAVAAKIMGHSVDTAIKAYCKSQESSRRGEMVEFLGSLQKMVLSSSESDLDQSRQETIPTGICVSHGNPASAIAVASVQPDCSKVEGCFFCDKYRLHADETDISKLMSCRRVLQYIAPLSRDSVSAEHVYAAVVGRIDVLLQELKRRQSKVYEATRQKVEVDGQLTRYWAGKLQQLHLLGMLPVSIVK